MPNTRYSHRDGRAEARPARGQQGRGDGLMRLGIRTKLLAGFGTVLSLLVAVGFMGWKNTVESAANLKPMYEAHLVPVVELSNSEHAFYELRLGGLAYGLADATGLDIQEATGKTLNQDVSAAADSSVKLLIGFVVLAVILGMVVAYSISRGIANGVRAVQAVVTSVADNCAAQLARGLDAMAGRDLTYPVTPVTKPIKHFGSDEIGQTAAATNRLLSQVQSSIESYEKARAGLRQAIDRVQRAASDVAGTSDQLGQAAGQTGQ